MPNCFAYGTAAASNPSITAVLPSSGSNEGNTRVTIIGSGFVLPVQVFFGPVEAQVLSVSFNQIIVLTPPASGAGLPNLNQTVDVRVHEVNSGLDATLTGGFRFVVPLQLTAIDNNQQEAPFSPVTIHGQGFLAPVAVSLAGIPATVISVSATELLVLPGPLSSCADKSRGGRRDQHRFRGHAVRPDIHLPVHADADPDAHADADSATATPRSRRPPRTHPRRLPPGRLCHPMLS